jgi:hypothetical protein
VCVCVCVCVFVKNKYHNYGPLWIILMIILKYYDPVLSYRVRDTLYDNKNDGHNYKYGLPVLVFLYIFQKTVHAHVPVHTILFWFFFAKNMVGRDRLQVICRWHIAKLWHIGSKSEIGRDEDNDFYLIAVCLQGLDSERWYIKL